MKRNFILCLLLWFVLEYESNAQIAAPDLIVNRDQLLSSIEIVSRRFKINSCAIQEHCVNAVGKRKLLRFDTAIANIGSVDFRPPLPRDQYPELYEFDTCHGHYHLLSAVHYELLDQGGNVLVSNLNSASCFMDSSPYVSPSPSSSFYACSNQGISVGWQSVVPKTVDCQGLDITLVADGEYILRVTVNPLALLTELDYSNNSVTVPVRIGKPTRR